MVHPGRHEVRALERFERERLAERLGEVRELEGIDVGEAAPDALRRTRRPRGVREAAAERAPGRGRRRLVRQRALRGFEAVDRPTDGEAHGDRGEAGSRDGGGERSRRDQSGGAGVLDDPGDLAGRQRRVQQYVPQPDLGRGELPHDGVDVVRERVDHDVAGREAARLEQVRGLVGARHELTEGEPATRRRRRDRREVGMVLGDPPHAEPLLVRIHQVHPPPT